MTCYHPLKGYREPISGKFTYSRSNSTGEKVTLPCGQCIGCRLERSRQWAMRCVNEAQLYKENSFITLTYDKHHIPLINSLNLKDKLIETTPTLKPRDFTLFMKKFRKKYGKVRYFQCGEYGDKLGRPHHHAILFGKSFPNQYLYSTRNGVNYYRDTELEKVWGKGMVIIGDVTFESAAYVARYIVKKQLGADDREYLEHYGMKHPEYVTMSRRPGIGREWYEKYKDDIYPKDFVTMRGGIKCKPPKYYDKQFDLTHPDEMAKIKIERERRALAHSTENTSARLAIREEIHLARSEKLIRGYENDQKTI